MRAALFILASLVLLSSAFAAIEVEVVSHNTDVQSTTNNLKVCSCGTTTDIVRVKNIGDLAATYVISIASENDWYILGKHQLYLEPGQLEEVPIFISAPCGATDTGTYSIHVSSEYGRYRAIHKNIQTGVCENVGVTLDPAYLTVQPCSSEPVSIHVTNTGTFFDTYTVQGSGQSVELEAGETGEITTFYEAACDEHGEKQIPIVVQSERNQQSVERTLHVTVPRAYDYTLSATAQATGLACLQIPLDVTVRVSNSEDRANTFLLTTVPATEERAIYIEGGESATLQIPYVPTVVGEQTFTVNVQGVNGTIEKSTTVRFGAEDCYSYTLEAPQQVTACAGELQVPFTITGTGSRSQALHFDVRSDMPSSIDSLQATVNPGQLITKTVEVSVPDEDAEHYVTLAVNGSAQYSESTTIINGYSTESCYSVAAAEHEFRVYTDAEILPVVITHTGIQPANYVVHYNGTFLRPVESNITFMPDQQAVLHLRVENVSAYELGEYVDRLILESHGVEYVTDFRIELAEKGFWQQFKDAIYYNGSFAVCSVISLLALLILLAVIAFFVGVLTGTIYYENPLWLSKETARIIGGIFIIALLIIMIFSGLSIPREYERPLGPSNASELFFEIGQADTLTLNLNDYFTDPDNETLSYAANQPGNLRVTLQDGTAVIQPRNGFAGTETIVFTAQDTAGGITDSDLITVSVVPYKPVTFLEYWMYGCWFFTATFLFLAAILALAIIHMGDKRKGNPQPGQMVVYQRPRTKVIRSGAHDLVEQTDTRIQPLPPGTNIGTVVNADKIVINQGRRDEVWIASEDGTKFHRMTCPVIKNMPAEKRLVFDTREEALKTGYTPCKTCSSHE